jgi:hypothetical protein
VRASFAPYFCPFLTKEEVDGSSPSTVTTEASILLGSFVFGITDDNALDAHRTRFFPRVFHSHLKANHFGGSDQTTHPLHDRMVEHNPSPSIVLTSTLPDRIVGDADDD